MKNIAAIGLAFVTAFASLAGSAHAQTREDNRQVRQRGRVAVGVATGQLTAAEHARVHAGAQNVQRMEDRAQADGTISQREAHRLEVAQDAQSRRITRLRQNNRTR